MFRFYELYSLYLKKMSGYGTTPTWCLCEKLPRSILHIAPAPNLWCEVCGRRRRPRACASSSDEEKAAERRQEMPSEQRRAEEEKAQSGLVRVKVAMTAKKPQPKSVAKFKYSNNKVYASRIGHFRKPQGMQPKGKNEDDPVKGNLLEIEAEAKASTPPPSTPTRKTTESLWHLPSNMSNVEAIAHEVCNRPLHLRQRQPVHYDHIFGSGFISLNHPITNAAGGAISKRQRRVFGRPLRQHCNHPLPPLSEILPRQQMERAKGGGLTSKDIHVTDAVSQFEPFDSYDGPSEDALVVDSAWLLLHQSNSSQMEQRVYLPTTQHSNFKLEPNSSSSSTSLSFEQPTAPPADPQAATVSAPLQLVAQSSLSDSSASSSNTSSSSSSLKSSNPRPESICSRGGEVLANDDLLSVERTDKMLWNTPKNPIIKNEMNELTLMAKQDEPAESHHSDSVNDIVQVIQVVTEAGDRQDKTPTKNIEEEPRIVVDTPLPDPNHSNDMSNELPFSSTNKSAGDAKYFKRFPKDGNNSKVCRKLCAQRERGVVVKSAVQMPSRQSMWSIISDLFVPVSGNTIASGDELKPLKSVQKLDYGTIKPSSSMPIKKSNIIHQCCPKCGLNKRNQNTLPKSSSTLNNNRNGIHKSSCIYHTSANTNFNNYKPRCTKIVGLKPKCRQKISNISIIKSDELRSNVETIVKFEPERTQSSSNSTNFESCFGYTISTIKLSKETVEVQPPKHTKTLDEQNQLVCQKTKSFEMRVQYACSELILPKMVSFTRNAAYNGQIIRHFVKPAITEEPLDIFEFRTPDIQVDEILDCDKVKDNHSSVSENWKSYIAQNATSQLTEVSSENCKIIAKKRRKSKKTNLPAWPAHPSKHGKRHIKYKPLQISDENMIIESKPQGCIAKETKCLRNRKSGKNNGLWIANDLVQQKINEMMTKPIRLLTLN